MYFEIENTPENIKRARKVTPSDDAVAKEECPRLVLAPFARPPQVVFDKVVVGTSVLRQLEVLNPSKNMQQITLGRALPPGLKILIPGEWLELEAETCYELTLQWSPLQPMALRETIRFVNESRRQFDIVVVLKTMNTQKKNNKGKAVKVSPRRVTKKTTQKKSPISNINTVKKVILDGVKMRQSSEGVQQTITYKTVKSHYKETLSTYYNDFTTESSYKNFDKSPFDSPCIHFDTSEIFSNIKKSNLQQTVDEDFTTNNNDTYSNILKPLNKQNSSNLDIFDNITFTPLKGKPIKSAKQQNDDNSFELCDKENNIQFNIPAVPDLNKWPLLGHTPYNLKYTENVLPNKKIPNTSSPKELDSTNFTINTDFSRISNDLSFLPHRFSTEKKSLVKPLYRNENELVEDNNINSILNSNTFTKSPVNMYPSMDYHVANQLLEVKLPKSKQALFRERSPIKDQHLHIDRALENLWNYNVTPPPRSISPQPLHAIAEESTQSESNLFNNSEPQMKTFTINRTFNKFDDVHALTTTGESWSKKSVRCEPELWKIPTVPTKRSISTKDSSFRRETINFKPNDTTQLSVSDAHNTFMSMPNCADVYSQSFTVDPFLSSTYFYDERSIHKFENEFKRWLNYILTPPADLDSNIEHKIDVAKIWVENRNKEIPVAPTKEQVCINYHNNHRLDALRKTARSLFTSNEFTQVIRKLNGHIDKKVICIRSDKNLHIDVGLQKMIMELLLCYNPLWLRIGLETIYGLVIPLKSNSDIEGLSTFIIQRMFRNPFLKSKNSKGNAPNMLLPAYLEAIKKFTLKKFFVLVYFLDRAKQNRLISHDPCLFCRNAICKESRELLIRFTRELIAGIGDITKHLRLLGYVVGQTQCYLDEYKYAVHNIASDLRDGVRLTKVMEIILMKNGLLAQLRTPAMCRLRKIHNVQVAFNALKDANFVIVGDITAQDIVNGHREKTLSLLWQIIHVFRAPLFQNAASVIQVWWRKKYEVIMAQRKVEEEIRLRRHNAASAIQGWWRGILYRRMLVIRQHQVLTATVIIQKYWRMWMCQRRLQRIKKTILLQSFIRGYLARKKYAKKREELRKIEEEKKRIWATTKLQSYCRMWLCKRRYQKLKKVIIVQSVIRGYLARKMYAAMKEELRKIEEEKKINIAATKIQNFFRMVVLKRRLLRLKKIIIVQAAVRGYLARKRSAAMREELRLILEEKRNRCAIKIQSYYRMLVCKRELKKLKKVVFIQSVLRGYLARKEFAVMKELKRVEEEKRVYLAATKIQSFWRMVICRRMLKRLKDIVVVQSVIRGYLAKKRCAAIREELRKIEEEKRRNLASIKIQSYWRMVLSQRLLHKLKCVVKLQAAFRGYLARKQYAAVKEENKRINSAAIQIQSYWRMVMCQRELRKLKSIVRVQAVIRGYFARKRCAAIREELRRIEEDRRQNLAATKIQSFWKMVICQRQLRRLKNIVRVQAVIRGYFARKRCAAIREELRRIEEDRRQNLAATKIQSFWRMVICQRQLRKLKNIVRVQAVIRGYFARKRCAAIREELRRIEEVRRNLSAIKIQSFWRMFICQRQLRKLKNIVRVQAVIRGYLAKKRCAAIREELRRIEEETRRYISALKIQRFFRMIIRRKRSQELKRVILIQSVVRRYLARKIYITIKEEKRIETENNNNIAATKIQSYWRMFICKRRLQRLKQLVLLQAVIRGYLVRLACAAKREEIRRNFAATKIQSYYRMMICSRSYHKLKQFVRLQAVIRRYLVRKQCAAKREEIRKIEEERRNHAATKLQSSWRMVLCKRRLQNLKKIVIVQSVIRAFIARKKCTVLREEMEKIKEEKRINYAATKIQCCYRAWVCRRHMQMLRRITIVQAVIRGYLVRKQCALRREELKRIEEEKRRNAAATKLQSYWRVVICKRRLLKLKRIVCIQAAIRGYLARKMVTKKKAELKKAKEEKQRTWAATKIQACYRAHLVRKRESSDQRVVELRKRWREGALQSSQQTISDKNKEALDVIANFYDIETVIRAFKSLEMLTEVHPMLYTSNARDMCEDVMLCMAVTNRSISSVELLSSAAAVLTNLARYPRTARLIYQRENVQAILKYMLRFCTKETRLFCIMCTYLWLFDKYDHIREDLIQYLHQPDNHKTLLSIKKVTERMVRMSVNANKQKLYTPQAKRKPVLGDYSMNYSLRMYNTKVNLLPTLHPDYGIVKPDRPRYFQDPLNAIETLFMTFKL